MRLRGISKRWFYSIFCVLTAAVITIAGVAVSLVANYYYNYVEMALESRASDIVGSFFATNTDGSDETFVMAAIDFIDSFSDKDSMEVWIIDRDGKPILSSSGFEPDKNAEMADYLMAVDSDTDKGAWRGKLPSGEKVIAVTGLLPGKPGVHTGAVRFISSLEDVESQIIKIALLAFSVAGVIILFVLISGFWFVRSIVKPVRNINSTAVKLAQGDMDARVSVSKKTDELDELAVSFNNMADALSKASEMKNDFISTISHELRTPLTAIKGWGETLEQLGDSDPETTKKGIDVITSEAQRLSNMVEELLDFSRMQSGSIKLNIAQIDILAELDEAVFAMQDRAAREGITLIYNVPHYPIPMRADADRMRQIFLNLIDNAIKYNIHGGKLSVSAEKNEDFIDIVFADTGCGISEDDINRVTDRFFRANMNVRGTGIGLAVVKELVELHGGTLLITSKLGEGTTVKVSFPLDNEKNEEKNEDRDG